MKWGETVGAASQPTVGGSRAARAQRRIGEAAGPVPLLFSGVGFTGDPIAEAVASHAVIQLIGLDRLYTGS